MKSRVVFICPKCRSFSWGTDLTGGWSRAVGHCHGGCGFSWKRRDDWKYFVRLTPFASKEAFARDNARQSKQSARLVFVTGTARGEQ